MCRMLTRSSNYDATFRCYVVPMDTSGYVGHVRYRDPRGVKRCAGPFHSPRMTPKLCQGNLDSLGDDLGEGFDVDAVVTPRFPKNGSRG